MGLFDHFPYTNFHELNLSWLLDKVKELENTVNNFVSLNTIKYADPIQWNITTQYEANTVVIDPNTGTAYLSTHPVPSGVALTNTDYWTEIFTLNLLSANQNITLRDDGSNIIATFTSAVGDWLIWNNTLYKVTRQIDLSDAYVVGYNLERYSVELFIKDYITDLHDVLITMIGDLDDLNTTDKTNLVNAINEVVTIIGDLNTLDTTAKDNIVNAINEIYTMITNIHVNTGYKTVADMIADTNLVAGDIVYVAGYYASNDGGAAHYLISSTSSGFSHTLSNGLYANLIITAAMKIEVFGGKKDDATFNNTPIYNTMIQHCKHIILASGTYWFTQIKLVTHLEIAGSGLNDTIIRPMATSEAQFVPIDEGVLQSVRVHDLHIAQNNVGNSDYGLYLVGTKVDGHGGLWYSKFENVAVNGFKINQLYMNNVNDFTVPNQFLIFENCLFSGDQQLGYGRESVVIDGQAGQLTFINGMITAAGSTYAALRTEHADVTFISTAIQDSDWGCEINGDSTITFIHPWFENCVNLIKQTSISARTTTVTILGGTIRNTTGHLFQTINRFSATVRDCGIYSGPDYIHYKGGATDGSLVDIKTSYISTYTNWTNINLQAATISSGTMTINSEGVTYSIPAGSTLTTIATTAYYAAPEYVVVYMAGACTSGVGNIMNYPASYTAGYHIFKRFRDLWLFLE